MAQGYIVPTQHEKPIQRKDMTEKEKQRLLNRYGPWALVTGGSSGIGKSMAGFLAQAGLNLVLNGRDSAALELARQELMTHYPVEVVTIPADLSTVFGQEKLIADTDGLDIGLLVNNAGFATSGTLIDNPLDAELDMLAVNVQAVLRLTHHFAQRFRQRQRSGIIFLSSIVAFQGVPFAANYAASKAYVQSLAEALAVECKPFHIDVLSATPGPVESGFGARADMRMNGAMRPEQVALPIIQALGRSSGVVPGPLSKLLVYALRTAPRFLKIRIMQGVMAGFTKHQLGR
jgi:hypothetical protein